MMNMKYHSFREFRLINRIPFSKITFIVLLFVFTHHAQAAYKFGNLIEPGKTTKEEVNEVYGEPVEEINSTTYRYEATTEGIDGYVIEYREKESSTIVEKMDIMNSEPYRSQTLAKKMELPEPTFSGVNPDGKFQEYFGDRFSVVFTYKSSSPRSGVVTVTTMTRELFESLEEEIKDTLNDPETVVAKREKENNKTKETEDNDDSRVLEKKSEKKEIAKVSPDAKLHMQQGMTYVSLAKANPNTKSENYNNALLEFSKAIELYPNYAEAYSNRGVVYMQQKKYNKAEIDLKKAADHNPKDPIIQYNLAALYSIQKKLDLALDALDRALENGFSNYDALKPKGKNSDPDLKNLREHPEYRKVLEKNKVFILY